MTSLQTIRNKSIIHISNLDGEITKELIYDLFIPFGEIVNVLVSNPIKKSSSNDTNYNNNNNNNNNFKGTATVEYESSEDADDAIDNMNLSELYGKPIFVSLSKNTKDDEKIDNKRPVWEQESYIKRFMVEDTN